MKKWLVELEGTLPQASEEVYKAHQISLLESDYLWTKSGWLPQVLVIKLRADYPMTTKEAQGRQKV